MIVKRLWQQDDDDKKIEKICNDWIKTQIDCGIVIASGNYALVGKRTENRNPINGTPETANCDFYISIIFVRE